MEVMEGSDLWRRAIEDRCRDRIYDIESSDDDADLRREVRKIVAWLGSSPAVAEIFLQIDNEMRETESNIDDSLLADASDELLAAYICGWRRARVNREARDLLRNACRGSLALTEALALRAQ